MNPAATLVLPSQRLSFISAYHARECYGNTNFPPGTRPVIPRVPTRDAGGPLFATFLFLSLRSETANLNQPCRLARISTVLGLAYAEFLLTAMWSATEGRAPIHGWPYDRIAIFLERFCFPVHDEAIVIGNGLVSHCFADCQRVETVEMGSLRWFIVRSQRNHPPPIASVVPPAKSPDKGWRFDVKDTEMQRAIVWPPQLYAMFSTCGICSWPVPVP